MARSILSSRSMIHSKTKKVSRAYNRIRSRGYKSAGRTHHDKLQSSLKLIMPVRNASCGIGFTLFLRKETNRCSKHSPSNALLVRISEGPQITRSMSSSSDGGKDRAGGEHIDRYHPNHTADYGQCVTTKVTSTGGTDSRPSDDRGSVKSDLERPNAT